jgi:ATP-binding protein involved in chromosome partitioning
MSAPTASDVLAALADLQDPETGRGLVSTEQIRQVEVREGAVSLTLALTTYSAPLWDEVRQEVVERLRQRFAPLAPEVALETLHRTAEPLGQIGLRAKAVIAVGSGKGGVGKSTIAASLAFGLKRSGCKVGLMDADVYGPSIPHLLGASGRPEVNQQTRKILPLEVDGLQMISMGLLVPPGEAVVWRGPMLHGAVTQFLRDTAWDNLDYLVIDMPPGTGDIALTLSQLLPLTGAVVVCTPQDVALLDAVKAIAMFRKVNIPILGMVENMSYFVCPGCGKRYDIFGHGGAKRRAEELNVPFLGEVPIHMRIRELGDQGRAEDALEIDETAGHFGAICYNLVKNLATEHRRQPPMPSLSVLP